MSTKQKSAKRANQDDMVFAQVPPPPSSFDRIAKNVANAVTTLNAALKEAHECAEIRVFLGRLMASGEPMQFDYQIYKLKQCTIRLSIRTREAVPEWKEIKDDRFMDAAGEGLAAAEKKRAKGEAK